MYFLAKQRISVWAVIAAHGWGPGINNQLIILDASIMAEQVSTAKYIYIHTSHVPLHCVHLLKFILQHILTPIRNLLEKKLFFY